METACPARKPTARTCLSEALPSLEECADGCDQGERHQDGEKYGRQVEHQAEEKQARQRPEPVGRPSGSASGGIGPSSNTSHRRSSIGRFVPRGNRGSPVAVEVIEVRPSRLGRSRCAPRGWVPTARERCRYSSTRPAGGGPGTRPVPREAGSAAAVAVPLARNGKASAALATSAGVGVRGRRVRVVVTTAVRTVLLALHGRSFVGVETGTLRRVAVRTIGWMVAWPGLCRWCEEITRPPGHWLSGDGNWARERRRTQNRQSSGRISLGAEVGAAGPRGAAMFL